MPWFNSQQLLKGFGGIDQDLKGSQLSFGVLVAPNIILLYNFLPGLWTLCFVLFLRIFAIRQPGPWLRKRHFEAIFFRFRQMRIFWNPQDPLR